MLLNFFLFAWFIAGLIAAYSYIITTERVYNTYFNHGFWSKAKHYDRITTILSFFSMIFFGLISFAILYTTYEPHEVIFNPKKIKQ
jgi:hypothetical protein